MIGRIAVCVCSLLFAVSVLRSQDISPLPKGTVNIGDPAKIKAVLAREEERRQAYAKLDPKLVGDLLAEDYLTPSQEHGCCFHNKEMGLQAVIEHRDAKVPHPITSMTSDQTVVRIYGNIAIVTGIEAINMILTEQTPPKPYSVKLLYTNIWQLRHSRWMLIGSAHETLQ